MKRLCTSLLALTLLAGLCTPVLAAEEDQYAMAIQVNGSSSATVDRGSAVTVTLTMDREGADTFDLYCMQDYVCFDPAYFTYVEDSLQVYTVAGTVETPVFSASAIAFPAGQEELNRIYVNRVTDEAQTLSSGTTVLTFQLQAVQNGTTTISHDKTEVFRDPMQMHPCAVQDASVTIREPSGGGTSTGGGSVSGPTGGDTVIDEPDTPLGPLPFVDVPTGAWYEKAVEYVYQQELMSGTSETTFSPNAATDRAMLVTILYRLEGSPAVHDASPFTDVPAGTWYTDAVIWGAANGIVEGYGNGKFGPTDPVTREQVASILYRYVAYRGGDVSASTSLDGYTDKAAVSAWAESALEWAVADGLISGTDAKALMPGGRATRAETAQILMGLCQQLLK